MSGTAVVNGQFKEISLADYKVTMFDEHGWLQGTMLFQPGWLQGNIVLSAWLITRWQFRICPADYKLTLYQPGWLQVNIGGWALLITNKLFD